MTYSYAAPSAAGAFPTLKDEVRFLAFDTAQSASSVQDEDVAYLLAQEGLNAKRAAANVLERRASVIEANARTMLNVGPFRSESGASATATAAAYREMATQLRNGGGPGSTAPIVSLDNDATEVPVFTLGMGYPLGAPYTTGACPSWSDRADPR